MAYVSIKPYGPHALRHVDPELFLDTLSVLSKNFTVVPDDFFIPWFPAWDISTTVSQSETTSRTKDSLTNYCLKANLPSELDQYKHLNCPTLTLAQRLHIVATMLESDPFSENLNRYLESDDLTTMNDGLQAYKDGDHSYTLLIRLETLFSSFCYEIYCFESALESLIPIRETIIKVFTSQNIRYATQELNFDKIYKILKSQFGQKSDKYLFYQGLIIDRLVKQPSQIVETQTSNLKGARFEKVVLEHYNTAGYSVSETASTGDFGIDILAQSNVEKIGIQCKNHSGMVGVEAVMQAHSGGNYYDCTRFIVYSTNGFTPAALEMASKLRVELLIFKMAPQAN
jgi:HJR/Mrr/RecB family endonuclease|tara:strand:- start:434 stop:1459 length:1026 start_codon:yes stop_codon:yes gene_type:complete